MIEVVSLHGISAPYCLSYKPSYYFVKPTAFLITKSGSFALQSEMGAYDNSQATMHIYIYIYHE